MKARWNIEALQQDGRVALGGVAVLLADDSLELAKPHAVRVSELGLRVENVARLERVPQPLVAHDDRVDHAELVEGELILSQDAELVGRHDGTLLRRQIARQQLHERRLARAVRTRETVPTPFRKRRRDVLEEDLVAVPRGDALDRNHELMIIKQTVVRRVRQVPGTTWRPAIVISASSLSLPPRANPARRAPAPR